MLTLYNFEISPYCWKVRIALAEKRIQHEIVVPKDRANDPEFLKLTPIGKVPVLVLEDGTAVFESGVINEFLNERYPSPSLLPNDPADRARSRMISCIAESCLAPALSRAFYSRFTIEGGALKKQSSVDETAFREGIEAAGPFLEHLDAEVEGQEYMVGLYSLADISLIPFLAGLESLLRLPVKEKWPNIAEWTARMMARDSVTSTAIPIPGDLI